MTEEQHDEPSRDDAVDECHALSGEAENSGENSSESSRETTAENGDLPTTLVAVGASAGGLESLKRFFRAMPEDSGMAFVVLQHLSPDYKSLMNELLERYNKMPVVLVDEPLEVRKNHIYLLPPKKELVVVGNQLISRVRDREPRLFLPINIFLRSLAASWGERSVGIILSGTGSDGTNGLLDVRDAGGIVIAESPETARFQGMPQSVINTVGPDAILAPEDMPAFLMSYAVPGKFEAGTQIALADSNAEPQLSGVPAILELLHRTYKIDFNLYKPSTITRRIERRLALNGAGGGITLAGYTAQLEADPNSLNQLYRDLLIGVTCFFRDLEAFDVLRNSVIPQLLSQKPEGTEIRIWDCGCSTGEEAYSIAILFLEAFAAAGRLPQIKILATDLHDESLQSAAQGVFSEESLVDMTPEMRARYFEPLEGNRFKVMPHLRKTVIFSRHNVLSDPPFTKIDLVSCRNLLIYLKPDAQERALSAFNFSLRRDGVLFLGASESLGEQLNEFEVLDRHWKFFRKVQDGPLVSPVGTNISTYPRPGLTTGGKDVVPARQIFDTLLELFVPNGLLINDAQELVHVFGEARRYLEPRPGRFSGDIASVVCKDLHLPLVSAMRNSAKQGRPVVVPNIQIGLTDGPVRLQMTVQQVSVRGSAAAFYMVTLLEEALAEPAVAAIAAPAKFDVETGVKEYIRELEIELQRTRESLQATVEELETSNEELQSSNEELLASNEELQSTNEELHSVNEELFSVNAEHEMKIEELNQISSDMRNLIQSTDTATIFLDLNMHLRLFTPKARDIFSLMAQDLGRDLRHFKPTVPDDHLFTDIARVLAELQPVGRVLACGEGRSYLRRCTPYRDVLGQIDGIVVNYTDTTEMTQANSALAQSESRLEAVLATTPSPLLVLDEKLYVVIANPSAEKLFGLSEAALAGRPVASLLEVGAGPVDSETAQHLLKRCADTLVDSHGTAVWVIQPDGRKTPVELMVSEMRDGNESYYVVAMLDVTRRKQFEDDQRAAIRAAESLAVARSHFLANMSHELRTPLNGVLGFADIALSPKNRVNHEKSISCLENIRKSGEHLLSVINEVLDFSKIDADAILLHDEPVGVVELVTSLVNGQRPKAEAKNLQLSLEVKDIQADDLVHIDRTRFSQVLLNLLGNAIKFTPEGAVMVSLSRDDQDLLVQIRDTGVGIAADDLNRVFRPFEQADGSINRLYGGTGLGLAIADRLIRLMGGTITIDSEIRKGTLISVRFPWQGGGLSAPRASRARSTAPGTAPDHVLLAGVRIVAAEDDTDNRTILQEMLGTEYGATMKVFERAPGLVEYVDSHRDQVDVVLLDLEMPGMNGYEAAEKLHKKYPELPLIAVSAHALDEARQRCLAVGICAHIGKPVSFPLLVDAIQRALASQGES